MIRAALVLFLTLASYASAQPISEAASRPPSQEIVYASLDLSHLVIFAQDGVRFGPPLDYRPGYPPATTRYFRRNDGVQCVSIGPPGNTTEYAIKRPIVAGERYQCDRTSFRVIRCFENCTAAVIEYNSRFAEKLGASEGYIYVNSCAGVVAFSDVTNLKKGIPLDSPLLRGHAGVLADPDYSKCNPD